MPMPAELMGRWETDRAEYADRFFELSADTLVIGTGGVTRQQHLISQVSRVTDDNGLLYTIAYMDTSGTEHTMGLYFDEPGGTLQLENQIELQNQLGMVWRKVRP